VIGLERPVNTRLVIGPNASMSGAQALRFFAGMCAVCLGLGGVMAARGYWPVLPFAGLEVAALGAALWVVLRRNRYREVLRFDAQHLTVEFGLAGEGARSSCQWPRGMTRVWLERSANRHEPTRLVLSCGGQQLIVGQCLTDAERAQLAARLQELIHPAGGRAATPAQRAVSAGQSAAS
jgi:uncharacterized membrane protein